MRGQVAKSRCHRLRDRCNPPMRSQCQVVREPLSARLSHRPRRPYPLRGPPKSSPVQPDQPLVRVGQPSSRRSDVPLSDHEQRSARADRAGALCRGSEVRIHGTDDRPALLPPPAHVQGGPVRGRRRRAHRRWRPRQDPGPSSWPVASSSRGRPGLRRRQLEAAHRWRRRHVGAAASGPGASDTRLSLVERFEERWQRRWDQQDQDF